MDLTAQEWLTQVRAAFQRHFPGVQLAVEIVRFTRVKCRAKLRSDLLVDMFFREETGRADYALVLAQRRVYGLDNLGGWHAHPLVDPESHVPIAEPTPEEAVQLLREAAHALTQAADSRTSAEA